MDRRALLVPFVSTSLFLACASDPTPAPYEARPTAPPTSQDAEVSSNAVVLDSASSDAIRVFPDALAFPVAGHEALIARLDQGVVLVGQPSTTHPEHNKNGFLRRVETFAWTKDGRDVHVQTTPASLADVFTNGRVVMNFTTPGAAPPADQMAAVGAVKPQSGPQAIGTFTGSVNAALTVPLSIPGTSNVRGNATAALSGNVSLTPQVWASATYENDARLQTTDLQSCFQPRPRCAQVQDFAPHPLCQLDPRPGIITSPRPGEPSPPPEYTRFGMWCSPASNTDRVFCNGNGQGCVESCSERYGAGSTCAAQPAGTDDQCQEMPGVEIPRVCRNRGSLSRLELGASLDLSAEIAWQVAVSAEVNGEGAVDQVTPHARAREQIGIPVATNIIIPGAVPIPVEIRGTVYATCEIAVFGQLEARGTTSVRVNPGFGIVYENGAFSSLPLEHPRIETSPIDVTLAAGVKLKCTPFKPRLSLLLFDGDIVGVGPYIEAGYFREITAQIQTDGACPISVTQTHGIEATIGGEFRVFGIELTPHAIREGVSFATNWDPVDTRCLGR
ncbi:MAG: hypothetical protein KF850_35420 [Labilithrix sp.]|nr:hypothetical protein [Labilithrix sp.]